MFLLSMSETSSIERGPRDSPLFSVELVEIAPSEASWVLSSAKPGNGIEQLLDDNPDTFWQSDGTQPHTVTIQFFHKTKLTDIWIHLNYRSDESYTPLQLSVRIGSGYYDLQEVQVVDLHEPNGWIRIPLALPSNEAERSIFRQESVSIRDKSFGGATEFIRTYLVQVAVLCNHQNGRDTHVRGVKLFGPRQTRHVELEPVGKDKLGIPLLTADMTSMMLIR